MDLRENNQCHVGIERIEHVEITRPGQNSDRLIHPTRANRPARTGNHETQQPAARNSIGKNTHQHRHPDQGEPRNDQG
jgi:hypothetical protein